MPPGKRSKYDCQPVIISKRLSEGEEKPFKTSQYSLFKEIPTRLQYCLKVFYCEADQILISLVIGNFITLGKEKPQETVNLLVSLFS